MAFEISAAPDFWTGTEDLYETEPSDRPTSVYQAILSMSKEDWDSFCEDVYGISGDQVDPFDVLEKAREVNTCSDLTPPVPVWLDPDGWYTVLVYDEE